MKIPKIQYERTQYNVNEGVEGDTIEIQIERLITNKEPIKDGAPLVYTERQEGVTPQHDIRTDRWEIAVDATTKIQKSYQARREENFKTKKDEKNGEPESTHGTSKNPPEGPK